MKKLALLIVCAAGAIAYSQVVLQPPSVQELQTTLTPSQTQMAFSNLASVIQLPTNISTAQFQSVGGRVRPDGSALITVRIKLLTGTNTVVNTNSPVSTNTP
jgi:hypothetical protein